MGHVADMLIGIKRWIFGMVRVGDLKVDHTYHASNRFNKKRADKIGSAFDEESAGTITVSERPDGSLWIIDGQHRVAGARIAGVEYLPAKIFRGLSIEEEAHLFVELSKAVALSVEIQWHGRMAEAEPTALAITDALADFGVRFTMGGGAHKSPTRTRSIALCETLFHAGLLTRTVALARAIWPEDNDALAGPILSGIGSFLAVYDDRFRHPRLQNGRLEEKLKELPASAIIRIAKELRDGPGKYGLGPATGSGGNAGLLGQGINREAVRQVYNRRLGSRGLPAATLSDLRTIALGRNPWG